MREAAAALASVSETPRLDAELLMAAALGVTRSELLVRHLSAPAPAGFAALFKRRLGHEPVAYIVGRQEFYGLEFRVTRDVLIPRADSETLIDAARETFAGRAPYTILDLGTGSGALLLTALTLWPKAAGIGLDRSDPALAVARANAARLGLAARAEWLCRDWTQPEWRAGLGRFDLILANPPYVEDDASLARQVREFEPAGALFAGPDGLDAYRALVRELPELLAPGAAALVEIGSRQAAAVTALATATGLSATPHQDLGGRPRALVLTQ